MAFRLGGRATLTVQQVQTKSRLAAAYIILHQERRDLKDVCVKVGDDTFRFRCGDYPEFCDIRDSDEGYVVYLRGRLFTFDDSLLLVPRRIQSRFETAIRQLNQQFAAPVVDGASFRSVTVPAEGEPIE